MPLDALDLPTPPLPRSRLLRREEVAAWQDGFRYLAEARRGAEATRAQALAEAAAEKQRGFEEGRSAGAAEAARLLAEITASIDRSLAAAEGELAALVFEVVEQVVGTFDRSELMFRILRQALAQRRKSKRLALRVAPAMVETAKAHLVAILGAAEAGLIEVEADVLLGVDAATLVSEHGFIELGLGAQLAALRRGLSERGSEAAEGAAT